MKVVIFLRKKRSGANSIEEIFYSLQRYMDNNVKLIELPYSGASPINIIKNIIFAKKHKGDVNHISGEVHYIAIGTGKKTLITIHDVKSITKGNFLKKQIKMLIWFKIPIIIANKISVISNFTKKELIEDFPSANGKVKVIYNPIIIPDIGKINRTIQNYDKDIILHIGTKPNKNLENVIKSIYKLPVKLIIVGKITEEQYKLLSEYSIDYKNYINIQYNKIIELYHLAKLVTFPSFYEGFGMPIIEANLAEVPIIVSDLEVFHEIANDAAYFVNPYSIDSIRTAIITLISNTQIRDKLIHNGKQNVKRFLPQSIADEYIKTYQEIYKS